MTRVLAELMDDGKHVAVVFDYDARLVDAIRRVPSRKWIARDNGVGGYNRLLADLTIMRRLREEMGTGLRLGPKLRDWGRAQVDHEAALRDMTMADDARLKRVPNKLKWGIDKKRLRPYQRADIKVMANRNMVNANQPGAGKTAETVLALEEAELLHGFHLVNAPVASLQLVWELEIEALYAALGYDRPTILTGDTPDERRDAIAEAVELAAGGYSFWLLINPAMVRARDTMVLDSEPVEDMDLLTALQQGSVTHELRLNYPELLDVDWTSFVIDEFHLMGLGNPNTQGNKGCRMVFEATEPARSWVLSGTPIRGKPIKLWGALNFLYPSLFTSKWRWADTWLLVDREEVEVRGDTKIKTSIGGILPGKEEEFAIYHGQYMVRRTTKDALPGMPEKNKVEVWCDMSERQTEQYRTFEAEAEWRLDEMERQGARLSASNVLVEYVRLKQFADAYCEVEVLDGLNEYGLPRLRVFQTKDSGKLVQLMERLGEECVLDKDDPAPALIFSQFNAMVDLIAATLEGKGLRVGIINGVEKKRDVIDRARAFEAADLDVLVLNTMAGTALNLARAESVHLLDETWTPDDQEQAEDRAFGGHRAVGKESGRCYYYRTRDTVEEKIKSMNIAKARNNYTALDLRRELRSTSEGSTE